MFDKASNASIAKHISNGWKPNRYLTNMSVAYFQPDDWFVSPFIFPTVPVETSSGLYYIFDKGDLARDNMARKPEYGKVTPMMFAHTEDTYACEVDQVIIGLDQISTLDYTRTRAPGMIDPRRAKVRMATEQMKLHRDRIFAEAYFKSGVWNEEWTGKTSSPNSANKEFYHFDDVNFDPISHFGALRTKMARESRREPNVLALGYEAYEGLKINPTILERVKYSGSTANPATINTNVLAQLLEIPKIVVLKSTYNAAGYGDTNMQFICDSKGALLCYANPNPSVDEPSAGYVFAWDMLGDGNTVAMDQWEGEKGTHTEFIEGLMSTTPKIVCNELGVYMKDCV